MLIKNFSVFLQVDSNTLFYTELILRSFSQRTISSSKSTSVLELGLNYPFRGGNTDSIVGITPSKMGHQDWIDVIDWPSVECTGSHENKQLFGSYNLH